MILFNWSASCLAPNILIYLRRSSVYLRCVMTIPLLHLSTSILDPLLHQSTSIPRKCFNFHRSLIGNASQIALHVLNLPIVSAVIYDQHYYFNTFSSHKSYMICMTSLLSIYNHNLIKPDVIALQGPK